MVEPRIAVGGAEAVPRRIADAERALNGHAAERRHVPVRGARRRQARSIRSTTPRTSADYRRGLVRTVVRRALERGRRMNESPNAHHDGSASRSSGWRTRRWSPAAAALPATSTSIASFTCGSCAPTTRTGKSSRSTPGRRARVPGVVAVWTAADIADIGPIDFREGPIEKLAPYRQPVLATDKVRYVGEPVAAVFAEDAYVAEDAADLVDVEIEDLPPLLSAEAAPGEFSPGRNTEADILRQGYGDVDAVFKSAPHIVELKLTSGRHSGVPLETRGALGRYDAARDVLELHGAAKVPHRNKELIARMLEPRAVVGAGLRVARRRRLRHPRRALSRGRAGLRRGAAARAPGEMDRGPARAPDRGQPFAQPAPPRPRRGRRRRRNPRHRRRDFPRQRRLRAHPRHPRRDDDLRRAAGSVPRAGRLPRDLPFPAHQQDAGRDLSRAGPVRDHVRARAAGRRHRAPAQARSDRGAQAQRRHRQRDAVQAPAGGARRGNPFRFRRLPRAARQAPGPM